MDTNKHEIIENHRGSRNRAGDRVQYHPLQGRNVKELQ